MNINSDLLDYLKFRFKYMIKKYFISDAYIIKRNFKRILGRDLELEKPILYNDKLQWLKLNWYDPLASKCADKYEVREYVKNTIGSKYLNEIYGVYESVEEIDLNKLPNSFVLKATHGSAWNIICKDKNNMDWETEFKKMKRWLKTDFFWNSREWVYKGLTPRIICEKYMSDDLGNPPKDYKIFCFEGEPKLIQVDIDRYSTHRQNFYDLNWKFVDVSITNKSDKNYQINKPKRLEEMLDLSRKLSKAFPHVRVDFYINKDDLVFGELTFFHQDGTGIFSSKEFELEMGNWIKLPPDKNINEIHL